MSKPPTPPLTMQALNLDTKCIKTIKIYPSFVYLPDYSEWALLQEWGIWKATGAGLEMTGK